MASELQDGSIAVGTNGGVGIIKNGEVVKSYSQEDGLDNAFVLSMLELEDGTLLLGSDGMGMYAIKDNVVKNIEKNYGLNAGVILRMRTSYDGNGVWISGGNNIYYMDANSYQTTQVTSSQVGIATFKVVEETEMGFWGCIIRS